MIKLIRLEWKKNNIDKYMMGAAAVAALLDRFLFALAFLGIANDADGTLDAAPGTDVISAPIELFTSMAFLIMTGVMLASFLVRAYKNRTMNLMFSYPIKRRKILISQMLAVWTFNFAALTLTKLLIYASISFAAGVKPSSFAIDFSMGSLSFYVQLLLKSAVIVTMGFIALFVGLAMKSSRATIVTSFLLIFLTQANVGDFTMARSAVFPAILTAVSLVFAALSLRGVQSRDLM